MLGACRRWTYDMLIHNMCASSTSIMFMPPSSSRLYTLRPHFSTPQQSLHNNSRSSPRPCSSHSILSTNPCSSASSSSSSASRRHSTCSAVVPAASSKSKYSSDLVRSVRAMPIKLISVSKGNSTAATATAQEWITKLARYTSVNEVVIKPNPKGATSPQIQKDAEAEKVLKSVSTGERVIILDERGREATSEDIARLIAEAGDNGMPLVFVVGGPFGHGAAVVERASDSVRLSRMVLNHQVAYIVLVEQLYRAWTIIRGEPYHH